MDRLLFTLECTNPDCRFRTTVISVKEPLYCPVCKSPMNAEKHEIKAKTTPAINNPDQSEWIVVLDNIRSVLNVGSIFRSADAAGINKIICCGITPTPDHPKLAKTSLGAEWSVKWDYSRNAFISVSELIESDYQIYCLEETNKSESIFNFQRPMIKKNVLVAGNEISGVDPAIVEISNHVVDLPMQGFKRSLNVAVAFGIAIYQLVFAA